MKSFTSGVVSRIAMCYDCEWTCEDNNAATLRKAAAHAERLGHSTSVEVAKVTRYVGDAARKVDARIA
jgi:hypothetical protein